MVCNCIVCGQETNKKPFYYKKFNGRVYCGMTCYHKKLKERFPEMRSKCIYCKKVFKIYPSDIKYNRGKICSKECKDKNQKESNHWRWKGASSENDRLRKTKRYKEWRTAVFIRDGRKCCWCESTVNIEADHIKPRYLFPELQFNIDNGRTLCRDCHKKTPSYMNGWLRREDFE